LSAKDILNYIDIIIIMITVAGKLNLCI